MYNKYIKKVNILIIITILFLGIFIHTTYADEIPTMTTIDDSDIIDETKSYSSFTLLPNVYNISKKIYKWINFINLDEKRLGSYGRLFIPEVGIDVALFRKDLEWANEPAQKVVDRKDSACVFKYGVEFVIADHKHQGFDALYNVKVGDLAFIKNKESIQVLICIQTGNGINNGNLYFEKVCLTKLNKGGYAMYTCNQNRRNVTITFWQPLKNKEYKNTLPVLLSYLFVPHDSSKDNEKLNIIKNEIYNRSIIIILNNTKFFKFNKNIE